MTKPISWWSMGLIPVYRCTFCKTWKTRGQVSSLAGYVPGMWGRTYVCRDTTRCGRFNGHGQHYISRRYR